MPLNLTPPADFKFLLYGSGVQIYQCNTTAPAPWVLGNIYVLYKTSLTLNMTRNINLYILFKVGPQADIFTDPKCKDKVGKHFYQPARKFFILITLGIRQKSFPLQDVSRIFGLH